MTPWGLCRTDCRAAHCGDGVLDDGEECDDGNTADGDRCSVACLAVDFDGDGVKDPDDTCPDIANPDQVDQDLDGLGDACDDDIDGDGLANDIEDRNGNGVVDAGETDPLDADTDGDMLCDGPAELPVFDLDGIYVCERSEDTNANGVQDSGETDPLDPDSDDDCRSDGNELFATPPTDPLDASSFGDPWDRDGDGIGDVCDACPDVWAEAGDDDGCPTGVDPTDDGWVDDGSGWVDDGWVGDGSGWGDDGWSPEGEEEGGGLFGCSLGGSGRDSAPSTAWLGFSALALAATRRRTFVS